MNAELDKAWASFVNWEKGQLDVKKAGIPKPKTLNPKTPLWVKGSGVRASPVQGIRHA